MQHPILTILTPNYNTENEIIEFLESIKNQKFPVSHIELIIIDNASTDKSVEKIKSWHSLNNVFFNTELILLESNTGIANAYNVGYRRKLPESKIVIRTESDVELEENCINNLVTSLAAKDENGIVGAKGLFFHDKKTVNHSARYINWRTGKVSESDPVTLVECDIVFGGTFAIKDEVIQKLGYFFKQDRFLANELELCTRVKSIGYKVLCQPAAISYHKGGQTTGKLIQNKFQFISSRESTLFQLEFNKSFNKFTSVFTIFLYAFKQLTLNNSYPVKGFLSALVTYIFNKDIFLPGNSDYSQISKWLTE